MVLLHVVELLRLLIISDYFLLAFLKPFPQVIELRVRILNTVLLCLHIIQDPNHSPYQTMLTLSIRATLPPLWRNSESVLLLSDEMRSANRRKDYLRSRHWP